MHWSKGWRSSSQVFKLPQSTERYTHLLICRFAYWILELKFSLVPNQSIQIQQCASLALSLSQGNSAPFKLEAFACKDTPLCRHAFCHCDCVCVMGTQSYITLVRCPIHCRGDQGLLYLQVGTPRTHRKFLNRDDGSYGPIPARRPLGMLGMPFNRTSIKV